MRKCNPKRLSRVSINTRASVLHCDVRVRVIRNGRRVVEKFACIPQTDPFVSHPRADFYTAMAQFVYLPPSQWVPNDRGRGFPRKILIPDERTPCVCLERWVVIL